MSSKINLQPCEYARKSSIFQDNQLIYHKLFDEALERYNEKQKRKDRVIDDYYEKN